MVHYTWLYDCLAHVQQIGQFQSISSTEVVLPYEGYLLPSGSSFLHPYYIFTVKIPQIGALEGMVILNLAGDLWDPVLRAAGAELCDKYYPRGVSPALRGRGGTICPHCAGTRSHAMDSLVSAGSKGQTRERMTPLQQLDWYCCSCLSSKSPSKFGSRPGLGQQYNTSSLSASKRISSPTTEHWVVRQPTLIIFDQYTVSERNGHSTTNGEETRKIMSTTSKSTPSNVKRSVAASVGSASAYSPNDDVSKYSPEAYSLLNRLRTLSGERLNFTGQSGECPPRVVSVDWVVHVIGLGEFIDYDASRNFSLPDDASHHPTVIKSKSGSGDDRYVVDDVVYYSANKSTTTKTINPFRGSRNVSTTSNDADLRLGRIIRFDCTDGHDSSTMLKVRPLYFHEETLDETLSSDYMRWEHAVQDSTVCSESDSDLSGSENSFSSDEESVGGMDDRGDISEEAIRRRLSLLKDDCITKEQLCGRPVVISAMAYDDLRYPHLDETIYASTEFYEGCYSGLQYRECKKLLKSWKRRHYSERHCVKASQDY